MIGTPSPLISLDDVGAEAVRVGERRARLVHAGVDRPAEMLQERAEQAPIEAARARDCRITARAGPRAIWAYPMLRSHGPAATSAPDAPS